jgi:hypothetical protein
MNALQQFKIAALYNGSLPLGTLPLNTPRWTGWPEETTVRLAYSAMASSLVKRDSSAISSTPTQASSLVKRGSNAIGNTMGSSVTTRYLTHPT